MATGLVQRGDGSVSFPSVNNALIKTLLKSAKRLAPLFAPTMQNSLQLNQGTRTVRWERIENFAKATSPLTLSDTFDFPTRNGITPTITPITADMAKYGNVLYLEDDLELMSVNSTSARYAMKMGENAGRSLNAIMEGVYDGAANILHAGSATTEATVVTAMALNDIREAVSFLDRQDAMHFMGLGKGGTIENSTPIDAAYMGICHSDVARDIENLTGFVQVERYAGHMEIMPGEIGYIDNVRWLKTSEDALITEDAGTSSASGFRGTGDTQNDVYDSYILGMEAIGSVGLGEQHIKDVYRTGDNIPAVDIIVKELGSAGAGDPLNEVASVGWKAWFAGAILNDNWLVRVRTLATEFNTIQ